MAGGVRRAVHRAGIVVISGALAAALNAVTGRVFGAEGQVLWPWAVGALTLAVAGIVVDARLHGHASEGPRLRLTGPQGRSPRLDAVTLTDLGVHPCELVDDVTASPYAPRVVDRVLRARLAHRRGGVVLLPAERLAGASRTLVEAAAAVLPGADLFAFAPDPRFGVGDLARAAAARLPQGHNGLLWLDERLDGRAAGQLAAVDVPEGLRVVGVVEPALLGDDTVLSGNVQRFLARVAVAELTALGGPDDAERAGVAAADARYAQALSEQGDGPVLLGAVLVARSAVRRELRGATVAARDRIAVLRVAVDWQRAGLPSSLLLTRSRLLGLAEVYVAEPSERPQRLSAARIEAALASACGPVDGLGHPLVESFASGRTVYFRPHRLLTALAGELDVPKDRPVNPMLWEYLAAHLTAAQRRAAGEHLYRADALLAASTLLRGSTDLAPETLVELGEAEYRAGHIGHARTWYRAAIDTDHTDHAPRAMNKLGALEKQQGCTDQARHWYRATIGTGHTDHAPTAMNNLGVLEYEQGHPGQARHWYRAALDTEHTEAAPAAMVNLGALESQEGRTDQARDWYRAAIETGHADQAPAAMYNLGLLEYEQGNPDETRHWWRATIDTGHTDHAPSAMNNLGVLENEQGHPDQAHHWYRAALDSEHSDQAPRAMYNLGVLEYEQGHPDEACHWLRAAIDTEHSDQAPRAMNNLGVLEERQGHLDQAHHWYRAALDTEHPDQAPRAMANLGVLEQKRGHLDQAHHWHRAAIDTEHPDQAPRAMVNLGVLEDALGNGEQAVAWLVRAEASGHLEQARRARAELDRLRARAYLPYQSRDGDNEAPYLPSVALPGQKNSDSAATPPQADQGSTESGSSGRPFLI